LWVALWQYIEDAQTYEYQIGIKLVWFKEINIILKWSVSKCCSLCPLHFSILNSPFVFTTFQQQQQQQQTQNLCVAGISTNEGKLE
jgi:hypothetical protein